MSNYRHGMAYSSEYQAWNNMRARCSNPSSNRYRHYGERGIKVCPRWLESFQNFIADMGPKPGPKFSLERKNVELGYEPGNCVWIPSNRQAVNTTKTLQITVNGVTRALSDWCKLTGLKSSTVHMRIFHYDWEPALAVTTPARKHKQYKNYGT